MVISTGLFIDGRIGELDLIRAGWVFMHRTMTDADRMRFEQMINTPGFCVKKFEEMFLLRRINPFAPSEEQRIMMFDHSDCACKNAEDAREISEMKKQLGEFLAKWENVFEKSSSKFPSHTSSDILLKMMELNENIEKNDVNTKITEEQDSNENGSKEHKEIMDGVREDKMNQNGSKNNSNKQNGVKKNKNEETGSRKKSDQDKDTKTIGNIQTDSKESDASILEKQKIVSQDTLEKTDDGKNSNTKSTTQTTSIDKNTPKTAIMKKTPVPTEYPKTGKVTEKNLKTEVPSHHGNAVAEQCLWNVAHISGKPIHPKLQYAEAAASSVAEPVETQLTSSAEPQQYSKVEEQEAAQHQPTEVIQPEPFPAQTIAPIENSGSHVEKPITVACAEDKIEIPMTICTDISPAITDNSRSAGTPDSGMISDISEVKTAESEVDKSEKETSKSKDPEKLTGRDGRRYRQKLREAEKAALSQVVKKETVEDVVEDGSKRESVESETTETENTAPTGKEKRRLKDKLRKEKKEQEKLMKLTEPAEAESGLIATNEANIDDRKDDDALSKDHINVTVKHCDVEPKELIAASETFTDNQISNELAAEETTEVAPEDDMQVKRLSKSQKKRAQKKAAKGEYVVNANGSHTVELLPGEYKIVHLDQDRNIKEVEFTKEVEKEVNGDIIVEEKKGDDDVVIKPKKRSVKNLLVAGNITKDILDKGKWLAYVIDDKNPNAVPKFGEVSTVDVAKTIKILDSKVSTKKALQQDGYVDDVDYTCTKNPGHVSTTIKQVLPELDADIVRENFAKLIEIVEPGCYAGPTEEELATQPEVSDLQLMIDQEPGFKFHTELARRTSPLLVGNEEFREFCRKYSKSKFDSNVISSLIKKYVDTRLVHHYERFKKFADRESHRISKCWTKVTDSSPFALMLMLYINNPTSKIGFGDIEAVLFPSL